MALNKTDYEIKVYQQYAGKTRTELAKHLALSIPTFTAKVRDETFTAFELQQLRELGVKNI